MRTVHDVDADAVRAMADAVKWLQDQGLDVVACHVESDLRSADEHIGFAECECPARLVDAGEWESLEVPELETEYAHVAIWPETPADVDVERGTKSIEFEATIVTR